jgi:hypothetical protein
VLIIYRNEPLLFVNGPPVFIKVAIEVEESTSVFILNVEELEESVEIEQEERAEHEETNSLKVTDPTVIRRIMYLATPFPRQVYQPLQFVLGDETLTGIIEKIEGNTVLIEIDEGDKEFVAVEMGSIDEILWRGTPFDKS